MFATVGRMASKLYALNQGGLRDCTTEMRAIRPGDSNWVSHGICNYIYVYMRGGTLLVATIYLQLIQNRYMFRSFTVLHCSHQHCVQPVASDVEVVGYF